MIGLAKRRLALMLAWMTRKLNGPFTTGLLVACGSERFAVDVADMSVGRRLRFGGVYGKEERRRIGQLIDAESHVIFIGTHVGALAIPAAKQARSAIFIEANPATFRLLSLNIQLNDLRNVRAHNVAVGEKEGTIQFVLSTVNSGGSKREPLRKEKAYYFDNPRTASVPMVTLDALLGDSSEPIDLMFMDIEGSEYFALQGMRGALQRTKSLVVEFIPHHLTNVAGVSVDEFLAEVGREFGHCYIPSKNMYVERSGYSGAFGEMFRNGESDEGVIFTREYLKFDTRQG